MRLIRAKRQFLSDLDRMREQLGPAFETETLAFCVSLLAADAPLPKAMKDHPLSGELLGLRDFHLDPDWVVIYRLTAKEVVLHRTGRHAELFAPRARKR